MMGKCNLRHTKATETKTWKDFLTNNFHCKLSYILRQYLTMSKYENINMPPINPEYCFPKIREGKGDKGFLKLFQQSSVLEAVLEIWLMRFLVFLGNKPSVAKSVDDDVQYAQSGDMMFSVRTSHPIRPIPLNPRYQFYPEEKYKTKSILSLFPYKVN